MSRSLLWPETTSPLYLHVNADDPGGPDSVRNNMDSWHFGRGQYLATTLFQPETLKGQGGD